MTQGVATQPDGANVHREENQLIRPSIPRQKYSESKKAFKVPSSKTLMARILIQLLIMAILVYPMLHIYVILQGDLEPYERGFFCDDENLKHPFVKEQISIAGCVAIWFCIVIAIVPSMEILYWRIYKYNDWEVEMKSRQEKGILLCFSRIPVVVIEIYRMLGYFFVGALGCLLTTELAKYKIGRLRPYYLTVCNLNLTKALCKDQFGYEKYVPPPHNCPGIPDEPQKEHIISEAKKSFLSGHSSFSFYCATFLVIYLHARLSKESATIDAIRKRDGTICLRHILRAMRILRPFLQFMIYALAIYIAITRISDYRHHPLDVVAGIIVGNLFAFLILLFMVNLFRRPRSFHDAKYAILDCLAEKGQISPENTEFEHDVDGKTQRDDQPSQQLTAVQQTKDTTEAARTSKVNKKFIDANQSIEAMVSPN